MRRTASLCALAVTLGGCTEEGTSPPPSQLDPVAAVPIPENYGIHDTFVRDGIAFVCAWNTGVMIYDVGNGMRSGSPSSPQLVTTFLTAAAGVSGGPQVHNAWWFWSPTGEKKYLFVGQEGPGTIGSSSSGDIHVVDVSDLANPVEVGSYHLTDAGTHNFWVDETAQVLYAAYYNGGVVAIDISGTLPATLDQREIARVEPGGPGDTFVWGVQLYDGSLYATDMLSGLWQLKFSSPPGAVSVFGGDNVAERYSSDLWIANGYGYTGTWGLRGTVRGNALKIWRLDAGGAPVLEDSIVTAGITTVSDVEVSPDGKLLMFSAEGGPGQGLYFYKLTNPAQPAFAGSHIFGGSSNGIHTATFGVIGGRLYAFAAKDPDGAALLIFDVTSLAQ